MKLILFDIDGTLISSGGAGTRSLDLAFRDLFGIDKAFKEISMAGKTDTQIVKEGLRKHNLSFDDGIVPAVIEAYLRNLRNEIQTAKGKHLKPGIKAALDGIRKDAGQYSLALLTGNVQQGAMIKLSALSIDRYFPFGAFGCDDENRNRLLPVATARFKLHYGYSINYTECVVVGDTPRDVECARHYGASCAAVATGPYPAQILAQSGADIVFEDLSDTHALLNWIARL